MQAVAYSEQVLARTFESAANGSSISLRRLAQLCQVPIGFEATPDGDSSSTGLEGPRIALMKGTIREALDALMVAEPCYAWEQTRGVVNVFPRERIDSLPNVTLRRFKVNAVLLSKTTTKICHCPEVRSWMARAGASEKSLSTLPSRAILNEQLISLDLSNVPVRGVLNQIIKASRSCYWCYFRYGRNNSFFSLTVS
jgi:hypothetical protein